MSLQISPGVTSITSDANPPFNNAIIINGTTNQISIAQASQTFTFSTPQNINTGASPTFSGLTLSSMTAGSVLFAGTSGAITQDNTNFFWDDTNNRLGIGTSTPTTKLQVVGGGTATLSGTPEILNLHGTSSQDLAFGVDTSFPFGVWIQGKRASDSTAYALCLNPVGGNVGIGTTAPSGILHVVAAQPASGTTTVAAPSVTITGAKGGTNTASNGTAGAGSSITITGGAGGTANGGGFSVAGAGGSITLTAGAADTNDSGTLTVGAAGAISLTAGKGGHAFGNATAGGAISFTSGVGGGPSGSGGLSAAGGNINITAAAGGTASGTAANANGGSVVISTGAAGTGGSGAAGAQGDVQIATTGGNVIIGGGATASELRILEASGSGTNYTAFKATAQAANLTYTLPAADATSPGQFLSSDGAGNLSWQTSIIRKIGQTTVVVGTTTLSRIGTSPSSSAGGTQANADDTSDSYIRCTSGSVSGNATGIRTGTVGQTTGPNALLIGKNIDQTMIIKTSATITSIRHWIGLFSADPTASATPSVHLAAFRYDTTADGTAFWRTCTDNGSGTPTVTTTTTAINASTKYTLRIVTSSSNVVFYINGTAVATHTNTLPGSTTFLYENASVTTLTGSGRSIDFNSDTITSDM